MSGRFSCLEQQQMRVKVAHGADNVVGVEQREQAAELRLAKADGAPVVRGARAAAARAVARSVGLVRGPARLLYAGRSARAQEEARLAAGGGKAGGSAGHRPRR